MDRTNSQNILSNKHRFSETNAPLSGHFSAGSLKKNFNYQSFRVQLKPTNQMDLKEPEKHPAFSNLRKESSLSKAKKPERPKTVTLNLTSISPIKRKPEISKTSIRRWQSLERVTRKPLINRIFSGRSTRKVSRNKDDEIFKEKSKYQNPRRLSPDSNLSRNKTFRRIPSITNFVSTNTHKMENAFKRHGSAESSGLFVPGDSVCVFSKSF